LNKSLKQRLLELVRDKFSNPNQSQWVLVIGDIMLDRYLFGEVERISPEAPVPVVLLKQKNDRLGGAANVAANLIKLGIKTRLTGYLGADADGDILLRLLEEIGIATDGIVQFEMRSTITKTRILGGHQQMLRFDQESRTSFNSFEKEQIQKRTIEQISNLPSIIVLSDYAKGVLSTDLCEIIIQQAKNLGIPVLVDPKGKDYSKYHGATALTPNQREVAEVCGISTHNITEILLNAKQLRSTLDLQFVAITRGEEGVSLIDADTVCHIPATAKQVFDVSGAGDTVISTLAAGIIYGLNYHEALTLANIAAGIVVGFVGTAPITREDLIHELIFQRSAAQADKICNVEDLKMRVSAWRSKGQQIVFTNGCFDLLHAGHVTYLEQARKLGDRLILGLNTDRSVSALKGPNRPVIQEQDRARVLAALESIDAVVIFDEDTPLDLICTVKPEVLVKGSDYTEEEVVGGTEVKSWGGEVILLPIAPGRSTSNILAKVV
jgi:D-beta-D-heptose 7-phosphate kinase / D-beta-D-heptose 1-phosphate adenosyltransferase